RVGTRLAQVEMNLGFAEELCCRPAVQRQLGLVVRPALSVAGKLAGSVMKELHLRPLVREYGGAVERHDRRAVGGEAGGAAEELDARPLNGVHDRIVVGLGVCLVVEHDPGVAVDLHAARAVDVVRTFPENVIELFVCDKAPVKRFPYGTKAQPSWMSAT